jgi:hypothetical protein
LKDPKNADVMQKNACGQSSLPLKFGAKKGPNCIDTVDGRNPASLWMAETLKKNGMFTTDQLVQDFFHPQ